MMLNAVFRLLAARIKPVDEHASEDDLLYGDQRGPQTGGGVNNLQMPSIPVQGSKYPLLRTPQANEPATYKFTAFHATSLDNWDSIKRKGLVPGKSGPSGQSWMGRWSGKAIYFHLKFPQVELDNSFDDETGDPWNLIIECELHHVAGYIVPDEDVSLDLNYVPKALQRNEAIAIGYPTSPASFRRIHIVDTPEARIWAKANVKRWPVVFHKPGAWHHPYKKD